MTEIKIPSDTLYFKDVVGTFEEFIATPVAVETIPNVKIYNNSIIVEKEVWQKEVYRVLMRRYKNWQISCYMTDDFLDMLWERIEIHTPNYFERKNRYDQFLRMTDTELLTQNKIISNLVEHTDDRVDNPLDEELKNVSSQTATKSFGDYANRLRSQIYNAQATLLEDYLKKFKSLFIMLTTKTDLLI